MIYEAKPNRVEAYVILEVGVQDMYNGVNLIIDDTEKRTVHVDGRILDRSQVNPHPGDYYTVSDAGAVVLKYKAIFEKSWQPSEDKIGPLVAKIDALGVRILLLEAKLNGKEVDSGVAGKDGAQGNDRSIHEASESSGVRQPERVRKSRKGERGRVLSEDAKASELAG
jgi:hypothetical protein